MSCVHVLSTCGPTPILQGGRLSGPVPGPPRTVAEALHGTPSHRHPLQVRQAEAAEGVGDPLQPRAVAAVRAGAGVARVRLAARALQGGWAPASCTQDSVQRRRKEAAMRYHSLRT